MHRKKIFISYASKDKKHATKIYNRLKKRFFSTFIDIEDLKGGDPWRTKIQKQIKKSRYFISLFLYLVTIIKN
ncbi:Toll-Interleukin receptor domain protein [Candidatus Magnetomorum sp. HK-1]|nr:Toll-Interleukin receptor domain protein [Candidatus Magnetomorum sp. HK-1]